MRRITVFGYIGQVFIMNHPVRLRTLTMRWLWLVMAVQTLHRTGSFAIPGHELGYSGLHLDEPQQKQPVRQCYCGSGSEGLNVMMNSSIEYHMSCFSSSVQLTNQLNGHHYVSVKAGVDGLMKNDS
jgi:hypothetical protein